MVKLITMAQYAIAYAPALTGGTPSNTQQTGSFYVGNLTSGVRAWNNVVPQSTTNTIFFASPLANVGNGAPYVMAMPNPNQPAPFAGLDQPQFFYSQTGGSFSLTDGAFISTCSYMLKSYKTDGSVGSPPVDVLGCTSVGDCKTKFTAAGWFQSYGFNPPA